MPRLLILFVLLVGTSLHGILPMRAQWKQALRHLEQKQPAQASEAFQQFEEWYGAETCVQEPDFQETFLRLWALAAIGAGQFDKSLELIDRWMLNEKPGDPFHAFLLFQKIRLLHALAQPEAAMAPSETFLQHYESLPERCLVRWYLAQAAIAGGDTEIAREQWKAILLDEALPPLGTVLAKAALATIELHDGFPEKAFRLLGDPAMGENQTRLWRSLLAPALTGQLLRTGKHAEALASSKWLHPQPLSVVDQQLPPGKPVPSVWQNSIRRALWDSHWSREKAQTQHFAESAAPDLVDLYALRLKALRLNNAHEKTTTLAQALIDSNCVIPPALQATAAREGIEALLAMQSWESATQWIDTFLKAHPNDAEIPDMEQRAARVLAGQGKWTEAVARAQRLLEKYPGHQNARSWAFQRGQWLLKAGLPTEARIQFEALVENAPPAWQPVLALQRGICLQAEGDSPSAIECLSSLIESKTSADIKESAYLELLKIHLGSLSNAFEAVLQRYQKAFAEGHLQGLALNLAGTYFLAFGRWEEARSAWTAVAARSSPESKYARRQLLEQWVARKEWEYLKEHAVDWIRADWAASGTISRESLDAVQQIQDGLQKPSLPTDLVSPLLQSLAIKEASVPPLLFLHILSQQWPSYRSAIGASEETFSEWLDQLIKTPGTSTRMRCLARLHLAETLEAAGREDSADVHRIAVLQESPGIPWEAGPAFILARTADHYDFPDALNRLSAYRDRFAQNPQYPDALFLLAGRLAKKSREVEAIRLLEEIVADWPDAKVNLHSALGMARLHIRMHAFDNALTVVEGILNRPDCTPPVIADALGLRIEADLQTQRMDRALVTGIRLFSLYSGFEEICAAARNHIDSAMEGPTDARIHENLRREYLTWINKDA